MATLSNDPPETRAAASSASAQRSPPDAGPIPPQVSLPKGGGSIAGIGEKFSANPATGTGSLTVPIATSPGRGGFGPALSLSYDSGSGNGPFGLGWSLSLPAITRRTDKGLPRYRDADESDIYMLSGAEDLVPLLIEDAAGNWNRATVPAAGGYTITRYCPRVEGLFARIERWTNQDGDCYWRSISRDNVTTYYGKTPQSRIANPQDPTEIYSWLISASLDDKGNETVYTYVAEDSANVDMSQVSERNRWSGERTPVNAYLSRIQYGNTTPAGETTSAAAKAEVPWLFEIAFDYGEGYFEAAPPNADGQVFVSATLEPAGTWPVRQDCFSHYRSTFEIRTCRLCRRILIFHHFPDQLGVADCLARSTEFTYQEDPVATLLSAVVQSGYVRQGDAYLQATLPVLGLEYSQAEVQSQVCEVDPSALENLPRAMDGSLFRWVDLDGEGLQCVLAEQDDAWFLKRNLTPLSLLADNAANGPRVAFEPLLEVSRLPALAKAGPAHHQLMNLSGDGRLDCAVLTRPGAGFYERTEDQGWESFQPLESAPNVDWNDPNLRFIDIDGDGFSDILVTAQDSLTYFPSLARYGFCAPIRLPKATEEEAGPAVIFAESDKAVFLADMSGDGLSDIVRIRNGEVCYWPNLGYGRFGAKVTMNDAPWFDLVDRFEPTRIRLADADGSGTTDILYLGADGIRLYLNQSGNSWSAPSPAIPLPRETSLASIQALDLLGNGTACLVWTSSAAGDAGRNMRYVNLMGAVKPYLLIHSWNNLGAETVVTYTPSTAFYLADRAAGTPWATRLPFPVQVVERVETRDWISRNRFVSRYTYHHGYYDGTEREFRGFGRVDQLDTEELGILTQTGDFPAAANIDAASYVPPVLTRTWFHTGAYPMGPRVTRIYDSEYWSEPGLSPAQAAAQLLPDSLLDPDLNGEELREALRSLKGSLLRQETYAQDGTSASSVPYSIAEHNYTVNPLQPFGPNRHAVFFTHACESLTLQYERTLYTVAGMEVCDPRTTHSIVLEIDAFSNETKSASIAYGRRYPDTDPLLTAADCAVQAATLVTYIESTYTNALLTDPDNYRTPLPAETHTYELTGYSPSGISGRFASGDFVTPTATWFALLFDSEIAYEAAPASGRQRRTIDQVRTLYRSDDLSGGLPLGTLQSLALPLATYRLAFTPSLLTSVYQRPQSGGGMENLLTTPQSVLGTMGGYALSDDQISLGLFPASDPSGYWWVPSGRVFYSASPGDAPATELATARAGFFLVRRYQDIFLNNTIATFDSFNLLVAQVEDPVGNIVAALNDYRVLQPQLITDANQNQSAVAFDALGQVVATAVMDKSVTGQQDSLSGIVADLTQSEIDAFLANPRGPLAAQLLGSATSRLVYDVGRFARPPSTPETPLPACTASILRETHVQDLASGDATAVQVSIGYSDGFGRVIQSHRQADSGPLVQGGPSAPTRWIVSGWTIWNNKGKPVRNYEPFFAASAEFTYGTLVGVSGTLFYDPVGRVVATLHPDHSWEKVVFDSWGQESWDAGDTVLIADPSADSDVGAYFARIPPTDYMPTWYTQNSAGTAGQQQAAAKAAVYAATCPAAYLDSLGRTFLTLAFNRTQLSGSPVVETHDRTFVALDVQGNTRSITDALLRTAMTSDYNMLGSILHGSSIDAGDRWTLNNALGKAMVAWDSRDHRLERDYDAANRPVALRVQTGSAAGVLAERTVYGDSPPGPESANLRGRIVQQYDAAGVATNSAYDFTGNLLSSSRELLVDYQDPVDWSLTPSPKLTGEVFTTTSTWDALNRPVTLTAPDASIFRPAYDLAGVLDKVDINLQGATEATPFVTSIDYDAKGQRTSIQYGNGSGTTCIYDPETYRLTSLTTLRNSDNAKLQALSYTYDPVGNITHIADTSQQTVYFANQAVDPSNDYTYDALYRLVQAQGRELIGLAGQPQTTSDDSARMNQPIPLPSDGQALQNYTETYSYDVLGNILSLAHSAAAGSWTSVYTYDAPNVPYTNNRLTSTTAGSITSGYTYDAHGNLTSMPSLPQMLSDFKDQLQATQQRVAVNAAVETTFYVYDASGQRVRKVNQSAGGATLDERIYLGGFEIYREYGTGDATSLERQTLHVMDGQQRTALVETLTLGDDGSPAQLIRYQFGNHLGSAVLELDADATIISYEEYYPYGSTSYQAIDPAIHAAAKRYRYTGKERDEETGFSYHGARYYAPWLGRWISCDPKGMVDGPNLYVYVNNSPINRNDPSGLQEQQGTQTYSKDDTAKEDDVYVDFETNRYVHIGPTAIERWTQDGQVTTNQEVTFADDRIVVKPPNVFTPPGKSPYAYHASEEPKPLSKEEEMQLLEDSFKLLQEIKLRELMGPSERWRTMKDAAILGTVQFMTTEILTMGAGGLMALGADATSAGDAMMAGSTASTVLRTGGPAGTELSSYEQRMKEIADSFHPSIRSQQTVSISPAMGPNGEDVDLVAATTALDESLRLPHEIFVPHVEGMHAEIQTMRYANANGYELFWMFPSRPFCGNCAFWASQASLAPPGALVNAARGVYVPLDAMTTTDLARVAPPIFPAARGAYPR